MPKHERDFVDQAEFIWNLVKAHIAELTNEEINAYVTKTADPQFFKDTVKEVQREFGIGREDARQNVADRLYGVVLDHRDKNPDFKWASDDEAEWVTDLIEKDQEVKPNYETEDESSEEPTYETESDGN